MSADDAPWHAHVYYTDADRAAASALRAQFIRMADAGDDPRVLFVGRMMDMGVGPHPLPQFEVHLRERSVPEIVALLEASCLRALVHPLTEDDLADHTVHARWIGAPLALDVSTLDPPGRNQGLPRFGVTDL